MDEGNVRISEHVRQHGLGIPRASARTRLIQPTTKDPAVGVSAVPRRAGWPGPEESGFSPSVTE